MRDPLDWLSVRYKLALMFVGVVFLAFGVGGYFVSTSARDTLEREILIRVRGQCRASGRALDAQMALLTRRSEDFASDGFIRSSVTRLQELEEGPERRRVMDALRAHLARNKLPLEPGFLDLVLRAPDGRRMLSVREVADAPGEWRDAPPPPATFYSPLLAPSAVDEQPLLGILTSLKHLTEERYVGWLEVIVRPGVWVHTALGGQDLQGDADLPLSVRLVDQEGNALSIRPELWKQPVGSPSALVRDGLGLDFHPASAGQASTWSAEAGPLAHSVSLASNGWRVEIDVEADRVLSPVFGLQSRFLMVGLALALLAGMLLYFPMHFIARPLVLLRQASQRIKEGETGVRVPVESRDEIGDLSAAFNRMVESSEERTAKLEQAAADLAERRQAVQRERDRLEAVIRSMQDGLVVLDGAGEVVLSNEAAGPLVPYLLHHASEVTSHHVCREGERRHADCVQCLLDPEAPPRSCVVNVGPQVYEIHTALMRPDQSGQPGRVLLARNITDRVGQDERHIHQERLAVMGEVAAVMAHELNNPLAAISMFAQMLETELPADSPHRESLAVILRNTETCKKSIRELLDYATGACPEVGQLDVHETLEDVQRFLRPVCQRAGVELRWSLEAEDPRISGDEIQVRQIFVNLIMNALQALDRKEGSIAVTTRMDGEHLSVDVEDDGPGIPEEHQAAIFRPFFTTKPRGEGTGLGLPTTRRIAEMHGGGIQLVHSEPGRTLFRVRLRRRLPQARPQGVSP